MQTTNKIYRQKLPYPKDMLALASRLQAWDHPAFLDSGNQHEPSNRYDILAADPIQTLQFTQADTSPERFLNTLQSTIEQAGFIKCNDLPFSGGLMGYLSYDFGMLLQGIPIQNTVDMQLPLAWFGLYAWAVVVDHCKQDSWLVAQPRLDAPTWEALKTYWLKSDTLEAQEPSANQLGPLTSNLSVTAYQSKFKQTLDHIREGDCYQLNLAQRFQTELPDTGSPWEVYKKIRQSHHAPMGAYLDCGNEQQLLSLSPERLLKAYHGHCVSSPIKGTAPRDLQDPVRDQQLAEALTKNIKERAENTMIVDMVRNDLNRNAKLGSVQVEKLCELQSFSTVHHLVSTVSGQIDNPLDHYKVLQDLFPAASITGAPKLRSMAIIQDLEPHHRGPYCGSIGYINANHDMDFNIAIRTLICDQDKLYCHAGGGITALSKLEAEYEETYHKVWKLLNPS